MASKKPKTGVLREAFMIADQAPVNHRDLDRRRPVILQYEAVRILHAMQVAESIRFWDS